MSENSHETVSVDFTVGIGDESFQAKAVVPAGQCNLTQLLPVIQAIDDSFIAEVTAQISEAGLHVSCKAGCGACCRQMVPLSIFEAEALTNWIRSLPEERQQELAQRFHQALLKLAAGGLIERMVTEDWLAETESARKLVLDYFYQRVPCPFLRTSPVPSTPFDRSSAASISFRRPLNTALIRPSCRLLPFGCRSTSLVSSTPLGQWSKTIRAAGFRSSSCLPG